MPQNSKQSRNYKSLSKSSIGYLTVCSSRLIFYVCNQQYVINFSLSLSQVFALLM